MNIPSVFSLIDTLCIFLCGSVIMILLPDNDWALACSCCSSEVSNTIMFMFCSYVIGLVYHRVVEAFAYGLRRSPAMLYVALDRYVGKKDRCIITKGLTGAISCLVFLILLFKVFCSRVKADGDSLGEYYDKCYMKALERNCISDNKVLEGQLAFVRNAIFLTPFCIFYYIHDCPWLWIFLVIATLTWLWKNIQLNQFRLVFDAALCLDNEKTEAKKELDKHKSLYGNCLLVKII